MGLIKDIKTIVKSDEMQRKLDKLSTGKEPEEKTDISGYRSSTYQTGSGSKATGNEGNGPPADGVDGAGATVAPSQSHAGTSGPSNNTNNSSTSYTDSGLNGSAGIGLAGTGGIQSGTSTNMSGNVSGGGSQGGAQTAAQEGANESDLQAELTAIDNMAGLTTAQKTELKEKATREWMIENGKIEPGYYTAKDIADERAHVPKADHHSILTPNISIIDLDQQNKIKGVIGFDVDGDTNADGSVKAVQVNMEKYESFLPAIQFPSPDGWDDADTPPVLESYTAGRVWTLIRAGTRLFSNSFEGLLTEFSNDAGSTHQSYGTDTGDGGGTSPIQSIPASYTSAYVLYSANTSGTTSDTFGDIGGTVYENVSATSSVGLGEVGQVPCGTYAGDTTACNATAPRETSWADTGAYYLAYVKGKFLKSPYDTLVPLKWQQLVSAVDIALGDGVNVVDTRKMSIEPSYTGGTIMTIKEANGDFIKAFLLDSNNVPIDRTEVEAEAKYWKPLGAD